MKEIVKEVKHLILTSAAFVSKPVATPAAAAQRHHRHQITVSTDFDVALKSHELAEIPQEKSIIVTPKVHDFYLNTTDNELCIPGGELSRTIILDKEYVGKLNLNIAKMDLKLDVSWADANISLLLDYDEPAYIFGLDSRNRAPIMPSASSLVSFHVQQFKKSYYAQQGITEDDPTAPTRPGEKVIVDSSSPENDIPESIIIEKATFGSFESGFYDVKDHLNEMILEERVKDTVVARLSMGRESKFAVFERRIPELKRSGSVAEVVEPANVKVRVPLEINKLIVTFSAGVHRRTLILEDSQPFTLLAIQKLDIDSSAQPPKPILSLLEEQEKYKAKAIKVIKAEYRYLDNVIDISEKLQALVSCDRLHLPLNHKPFLFQVDPMIKFEKGNPDERIIGIDFEAYGKLYHVILKDSEALYILGPHMGVDNPFFEATLKVVAAGKVSKHGIDDISTSIHKRIRNNMLYIPFDSAGFKDRVARTFGIKRAIFSLLGFGPHKIFWIGMVGHHGLKVVALQNSLERRLSEAQLVDTVNFGDDKFSEIEASEISASDDISVAPMIQTSTQPYVTRRSSLPAATSAIPQATISVPIASSVQPATSVIQTPIISSSSPITAPAAVLSQTQQSTMISQPLDPHTTDIMVKQPAVITTTTTIAPNLSTSSAPTEERVELIATRPGDVTVVEKARTQEHFQSPIMQTLLSYLDYVKITVNRTEVTLGDIFCVLFAQPFLLLMSIIWFSLIFLNTELYVAIAAGQVFLRSCANLIWYVIADTVVVMAITMVYSLFTSPPFAIWLRSKIRQEYEEFLIVKRARDSTVGKMAKNFARWIFAASNDVRDRGTTTLGVDLNTTNIGTKVDSTPSAKQVTRELL